MRHVPEPVLSGPGTGQRRHDPARDDPDAELTRHGPDIDDSRTWR
ncbi:hypothetical protein FM110_03590 [Brachybacterium nesterenkovii]|uniref:Uncharacterized protein n=1 Tax=Brachybacterium nesterenkovii TaxID=47847 RepID=A0A1X6WVQ8_9MICO|nr:hypothetical protein FM110_03590 [Brachybacterium nesterenkovii]